MTKKKLDTIFITSLIILLPLLLPIVLFLAAIFSTLIVSAGGPGFLLIGIGETSGQMIHAPGSAIAGMLTLLTFPLTFLIMSIPFILLYIHLQKKCKDPG